MRPIARPRRDGPATLRATAAPSLAWAVERPRRHSLGPFVAHGDVGVLVVPAATGVGDKVGRDRDVGVLLSGAGLHDM